MSDNQDYGDDQLENNQSQQMNGNNGNGQQQNQQNYDEDVSFRLCAVIIELKCHLGH